jgi:uncharacterized membrane protein
MTTKQENAWVLIKLATLMIATTIMAVLMLEFKLYEYGFLASISSFYIAYLLFVNQRR